MPTFTRLLRWHPPLMVFSLLMLGLTVVSLVGLAVDDRILVGSPIWFKPFKFAVSFVLYSIALAWMLTLTTRFQRVGWWAGTVIALCSAVEMAVIVWQVVRGSRSHFNVATPFDELMWNIMTTSILVLWIMHAVVAVTLLFTRFADRTAGLAVRLGLLLALVGLALGILMTRQSNPEDVDAGIVGAHGVGAPDDGPQMALTGWSTTGGDLRVPHFVGIHALQVIPLATLLFGRRANAKLVWGLAIGYAGLMALVTWQALRGQPLLRPDLPTALGALAVATWIGAATAWALRTTRPTPVEPTTPITPTNPNPNPNSNSTTDAVRA